MYGTRTSAYITRDRFSDGEVKITIWKDRMDPKNYVEFPTVAGYIRRKRINGAVVYVLTDRRDWYVNAFGSIRPAMERARSIQF